MRDPRSTRGYRNRNPGNIEWNERNKWQGQIGRETTGDPPRFAVFQSHEYGIRALAMLLIAYQDRHGLRTIAGILNRWAPHNENDTAAYIGHVVRLTKRDPNEQLNLHSYEDLRPLVEAIITHELGGNPYDGATIDAGLRMAGVPRRVTTLLDAAVTGTGHGAITVGTVASAAAAAAPAIEALGGLPPWIGVALILGATAVAVAMVLSRRARDA